ncbi:MAG: SRPBCC domain-containing protein [Acidimicrobiales bacterium]
MSDTEPLVYTFVVACGRDHAFDVWTTKINRWWPKNHSLSGDADPRIAIEGHIGGRIVERGRDGAEFEWGRITIWEPPAKLAYSWYAGSTPDRPTDVEVTFDESDGTTTVQLTSSGWERFEDGDRLRKGNEQGWGAATAAYRSELSEAASQRPS